MTHLDWYDILFMVAIPVLGVATIMGYALHTGVPRTLLERGFTFRTVFGERFVAWNALSIRVTACRILKRRFCAGFQSAKAALKPSAVKVRTSCTVGRPTGLSRVTD